MPRSRAWQTSRRRLGHLALLCAFIIFATATRLTTGPRTSSSAPVEGFIPGGKRTVLSGEYLGGQMCMDIVLTVEGSDGTRKNMGTKTALDFNNAGGLQILTTGAAKAPGIFEMGIWCPTDASGVSQTGYGSEAAFENCSAAPGVVSLVKTSKTVNVTTGGPGRKQNPNSEGTAWRDGACPSNACYVVADEVSSCVSASKEKAVGNWQESAPCCKGRSCGYQSSYPPHYGTTIPSPMQSGQPIAALAEFSLPRSQGTPAPWLVQQKGMTVDNVTAVVFAGVQGSPVSLALGGSDVPLLQRPVPATFVTDQMGSRSPSVTGMAPNSPFFEVLRQGFAPPTVSYGGDSSAGPTVNYTLNTSSAQLIFNDTLGATETTPTPPMVIGAMSTDQPRSVSVVSISTAAGPSNDNKIPQTAFVIDPTCGSFMEYDTNDPVLTEIFGSAADTDAATGKSPLIVTFNGGATVSFPKSVRYNTASVQPVYPPETEDKTALEKLDLVTPSADGKNRLGLGFLSNVALNFEDSSPGGGPGTSTVRLHMSSPNPQVAMRAAPTEEDIVAETDSAPGVDTRFVNPIPSFQAGVAIALVLAVIGVVLFVVVTLFRMALLYILGEDRSAYVRHKG